MGYEFTADEEALLAQSVVNTSRLTPGQLQAYEKAYRPNERGSYTRRDRVSYEAIRREMSLRGLRIA